MGAIDDIADKLGNFVKNLVGIILLIGLIIFGGGYVCIQILALFSNNKTEQVQTTEQPQNTEQPQTTEQPQHQ